MRNAIGTAVVLSAISMLVGGCYMPTSETNAPDGYAPPGGYYGGTTASALSVSNATLAGQLGDVAIGTGTWQPQASYSFGDLNVETDVQSDGGAAMTVLDIYGTVQELQPGASLTATSYDGGAALNLLGCSGPQPDNWQFDSTADQVQLNVTDGSAPGLLRFDYQATYDLGTAGTDTVEGSFELDQNELEAAAAAEYDYCS